MLEPVANTNDALRRFQWALRERNIEHHEPYRTPTGDPGFFHYRIETVTEELYHLKFTKNPYRPKPTHKVSEFAKELDEKLKHAIRVFGQDEDTLIGINENLILEMLEISRQGKSVYFLTVVGDGRILWRGIEDFYNFVMRYDTFFKFARDNVPQAMVPTGWLIPWAEVISQPPVIVK